jgi:glycosyltransferase involved in cell wall biosynthesis
LSHAVTAARPLKIVHCFRSPVGGIFRHVRDLVDAQVAAGHQVGIVCDSTTGGAFEEKLFREIESKLALGLTRVAMQRHIGPGDIFAAWRTFKVIKGLHPDVLHGHGAKGGVYSRVFGSLLRVFRSRVARLYSAHGGSLHYDEDTLTGKTFFRIESFLEKITDHLLFVSKYELTTYTKKVHAPRVPFSVIYNGLQADEFEPSKLNADASDFLFIGMMRDLKGPDIFIDAFFRACADTGKSLTGVMVGDGEDRQKYIAQVKSLGLADQITFHMPMPARQAFPMAKAIVVPSRAEAMPYIVLEALAAGKPMIASAVGGIPEIFGAGSYALIKPDPAELAQKMAAFVTDSSRLKSAMPAIPEMKSKFGADVMAREIEARYRAIAA